MPPRQILNCPIGTLVESQVMSSSPKISVLLPVRNGVPFLEEAVTSLTVQTFADFEIVAVDDGSSDGSHELLVRLAANDARIRVFQQGSLGLVHALNFALSKARGE